MRGKCETCDFYVEGLRTRTARLVAGEWQTTDHPRMGTCHIRSVVGDWPTRHKYDGCGEYQPNAASLKRQLCEGPEVHTADRVEKSMGERVEEPS